MPSKSIFRQPGAKHFQLVHRSQRDPLINDPEFSKHVLKPIDRENAKKGKSRADLESIFTPEEISSHQNIGEANLYGIYYDDTDYDYMQHLRTVGEQEDGVESILVETPFTSKRRKEKSNKNNDLTVLDLPEGVLASISELPRNFESQQSIPDSIAGFQPDMDAHLRQVLEALEDDAYVDDSLEDNFFKELVADGERNSDEEVDFEFKEDGIEANEQQLIEEESWEKFYSVFKNIYDKNARSDDGHSESDTVGSLPTVSVIGGKKGRRKGTSVTSGYSMSSSSMLRSETLQTLDKRFDQIMLNEYKEDRDEKTISEEGEQSDEAPELITSRDDFDAMVNDFLDNYEILGRKLKAKLEGETGVEKLDNLRHAMGHDERVRIADGEDELEDVLFPSDNENEKGRWDCETILTTYSNLENHPRLIRARDSKSVPKIHLDPKTGFPTTICPTEQQKPLANRLRSVQESDSEESDNNEMHLPRQTVTRPRNESKGEKKARKSTVKQEKQARRIERKLTKEQFDAELVYQKKRIENREHSRLKKL